MKKIFGYLIPFRGRIALGLTIKFTGTIMDLLLPWILSYMIDTIVPRKSIAQIILWGVIMAICAVIALVTNVIANRMASRVAQRCTQAVRHDLFSRISYLSCSQIDKFTIPSLESRLTTDTYNIHQMVGMMQRLGVRAPILLLGGVILTLMLEPVLATVMICTLPLLGAVVFTVSKRGIPLYSSLQRGIDRMVRTVRENITGIRVIKALSKTEYEKGRFKEVNSEVVRREKKAGITMALTNPSMNLFLNLGLAVVILVGAVRVNAGLTQPGKILAFLTYFTIILNALLSITRIFVMISKATASAERIREVLDEPDDLTLSPDNSSTDKSHIAFKNVCFAYGKGKTALDNINFELMRGQTLGILGATGSGKSTIISLLMRLYDATSGKILIDGVDVKAIEPKELNTKFGVVFQNDFLFADSIRQNIDFGRGLSDEQIQKAAACAQAMEFIKSLDDGFEHQLSAKGTNLSGGQKQRILIARALASTPEILVLDDSSSALDYKTDSKLRKALREHYKDTTTIIVAQRISSIKHCDHILVLDDGKEIGYGTHQQLLQSCEVYNQISQSQMGGGVNVATRT